MSANFLNSLLALSWNIGSKIKQHPAMPVVLGYSKHLLKVYSPTLVSWGICNPWAACLITGINIIGYFFAFSIKSKIAMNYGAARGLSMGTASVLMLSFMASGCQIQKDSAEILSSLPEALKNSCVTKNIPYTNSEYPNGEIRFEVTSIWRHLKTGDMDLHIKLDAPYKGFFRGTTIRLTRYNTELTLTETMRKDLHIRIRSESQDCTL